jgi:hypothetical protein
MSLRHRIRDLLSSPAEPAPPLDPLERFRGVPSKLLADFDILAHGQGLLGTMTSGLPMDPAGNPIPWLTYPAIEYLNQFDVKDKKIFEYGCGQSTAYWKRRGAQVWGVEHDRAWFEKLTSETPATRTIYFADAEMDYAAAIERPGTHFDIVVIDGVFRTACVEPALAHLRSGGFIILDNAERDVEVGQLLRQHGLFPVDFNGFGPINDYTWTTSLFLTPKGITGFNVAAPNPIGGYNFR